SFCASHSKAQKVLHPIDTFTLPASAAIEIARGLTEKVYYVVPGSREDFVRDNILRTDSGVAGNIDYDNVSQEAEEPPSGSFRSRRSPVWKPRDSSLEATSTTLPRKGRDHTMAALCASRKSLIETSTGLEIHNTYNQQ
ncbi:hypothetical protein NQ318_021631, partial [Aromia moschata]